ncbi:hypothetical protein B0H14DRAFT_1473259 [Mycena olivaceomarginata]|nr:hypothetical protein B0H14DRAFT_1473259 [Mycena olivaceomarginata]
MPPPLSTLSARAAHYLVPDAAPVLPCLSPLTAAWAMNRPLPTLSCSAPPHLPSLGSSQYPARQTRNENFQFMANARTSSSLPHPQRWWPLPHPGSVPIMLFSVFAPKKTNRPLTFSLFQKIQVSSLFSIPTQPRRDNASHGALWNGYEYATKHRGSCCPYPSITIHRTRRLRRSIRRMTVSAQYAQHTDAHGRPFAAPHRTRPRQTPAARPPLSSWSCNLTIALTDGILDVAHRGRNGAYYCISLLFLCSSFSPSRGYRPSQRFPGSALEPPSCILADDETPTCHGDRSLPLNAPPPLP